MSDLAEKLSRMIDAAVQDILDMTDEEVLAEAEPGDDCCEYCNDGDGHCAYPIYGLAPHYHERGNSAVSIFGSTRFLPREQWPANFREDAEAPYSGTYTHCPVCGRGGDE